MAAPLRVRGTAGKRAAGKPENLLVNQRNGSRSSGAGTKAFSDEEARELAHLCRDAAVSKKAENTVLLDIRKAASFADFFVIGTGRSLVQVRSIADAVIEATEVRAASPLRKEGYADGNWVLIDYGAVIVHIFTAQAREFYNLERLWGKPQAPPKKR